MPVVYELRHMFPAELSGGEKIFFTRDNEHRLAELPQKQRDWLIERGYIRATDVTDQTFKEMVAAKTMREDPVIEGDVLADDAAQQPNRDVADAREAKVPRKGGK